MFNVFNDLFNAYFVIEKYLVNLVLSILLVLGDHIVSLR